MRRYSRRRILAGLVVLGLLPLPGKAQEAPLRIIFPYPPGGSGDAVGRLVGEHLQKVLGQPVIFENKTGAGGAIGAQTVKRTRDHGNTLLLAAAAQITLQPHLIADLGYDPFADFVPVSQIVTFDQALAVNAQVPATDLETLAAWIKTDPRRGNFGSPGEGTGAHLAGLAFGRTFGLALSHVPYRGTPAALPELITGQLSMFIASNAELIPTYRRGQIRILATAGEARSTYLPDVPTFQEEGVDIIAPGWFGFYAPAEINQGRVAQLERHIGEAMREPAIKSLAESLSFQVSGTTSADLGRIQREQFERWGAAVKASGLAMR